MWLIMRGRAREGRAQAAPEPTTCDDHRPCGGIVRVKPYVFDLELSGRGVCD